MIKTLVVFFGFFMLATTVPAQTTTPPLKRAGPDNSGSLTRSGVPLNVMTFNIRYGKAKDGPDAWPLRKTRTFRILQKYKPDVVGMQEALWGQIQDIKKAMPSYGVVGVGREDGRIRGEFAPIMYNTGRLQLLRSDTFWMSETPDVPDTTSWGNYIVRICTWAYFYDLRSRRCFYQFNTHLDHISQLSREKSAAMILDRIKKVAPKDPVLVTGDFNSGEQNPAIDEMRKGGFRDTFRVLYPDLKIEGTTTAFKPRRQRDKIDYVFVDGAWNVEAAAIPDDKYDGRWPSDHLPVTAEVVLK